MTDTNRRQRIEELCDAALDRDPQERAAFLTNACEDDDALREEVERLLTHANAADDFLATPITVVAAEIFAEEPSSLVGRQIGVYKILSLLGAGGMDGKEGITHDLDRHFAAQLRVAGAIDVADG